MNVLNGILRKMVAAWTGRTFAKDACTVSNGTTTYTFNFGYVDGDMPRRRMVLQPVTVKAK